MPTPTTTEDTAPEAGERPGGLKYVLLRAETRFGTDETVRTEDVTGAVDDLTTGLRPWLLAYLRNGIHDNGWYIACLVAANGAGDYDTYLSLATEDVLWYWDKECAPVSRTAN